MKKILSAILILIFASTMNGQEAIDESICTAPEGFLCGSKKGKKTFYIYPPGSLDQSFDPIVLSVDCCVDANSATACNVKKLGCSDVKLK